MEAVGTAANERERREGMVGSVSSPSLESGVCGIVASFFVARDGCKKTKTSCNTSELSLVSQTRHGT